MRLDAALVHAEHQTCLTTLVRTGDALSSYLLLGKLIALEGCSFVLSSADRALFLALSEPAVEAGGAEHSSALGRAAHHRTAYFGAEVADEVGMLFHLLLVE